MAALTTELDEVRNKPKVAQQDLELTDQNHSQQLPDLEAMRDRILKDLKLGRQAPGYKAAVKALDRFIDELRSRD